MNRKNLDSSAEKPFDAGLDLGIEVIDLIHKIGTQRNFARLVQASEPVGSKDLAVKSGTQIDVHASLESVEEGIWVSGSASATAQGECSRCLDTIDEELEVSFDELFFYPQKINKEELGEVAVLEADQIHLGALVHDAFAVAAPYKPLCKPDCLGLCSQCGIRLEDDPDHQHEYFDPRFAALAGFFEAEEEKN